MIPHHHSSNISSLVTQDNWIVECVEHRVQCQWTLTLENASIQAAGREHDEGTSHIAIAAGKVHYAGITGEMASANNGDGMFLQTLHYRHR